MKPAEKSGALSAPYIAFGDAADTSVLNRMATTTGGRFFTADPASIGNVYISISAEQ